MQFSSMSPRERHSSGTVININHNLLPAYMSLSTPCFNFIKHNQVFCTPVLSHRFRNIFLFPSKSCFTFCFPIHPLIFQSQNHSTVLLLFQCPSAHPMLTATLQSCCPGLLQVNRPLKAWNSNQQPQRASCYCQVKQDSQTGHQCNHSCPIWISHLNDPTAAQQLKGVKVMQEILRSLQQRFFYYFSVPLPLLLAYFLCH